MLFVQVLNLSFVCFQVCLQRVRDVSVCLLARLVDDSDWLLLFDGSGSGVKA